MTYGRQEPSDSVARSHEERVILVDEFDRETGTEEKLRAHERGVLHRAFSIFVFDGEGQLLMQQRAAAKYHSGGLWSNTCCGHPRPGETIAAAAKRRLAEEMGISPPLDERFVFTYRAELGRGLVEHECDHVLIGRFGGVPAPDPREVSAWGWMKPLELMADCTANPGRFTAWLPIALAEVISRGLAD